MLVDIDDDGADEAVLLIGTDDGNFLTMEGHRDTPGVISGPVGDFFAGLPVLGWNDWDLDGVPEFFTPGDGGASGVRSEIYTINGCAVVPVVNQDGQAMSLWNRASGLSANNYRCVFNPQGALSSFETIATTIDGTDGSSTSDVIAHSYADGILTAGEGIESPGDTSTGAGDFAGCVIVAE